MDCSEVLQHYNSIRHPSMDHDEYENPKRRKGNSIVLFNLFNVIHEPYYSSFHQVFQRYELEHSAHVDRTELFQRVLYWSLDEYWQWPSRHFRLHRCNKLVGKLLETFSPRCLPIKALFYLRVMQHESI